MDTALFTPWTTTKTSHPGRMSPMTGFCFLIIGLGLLLLTVISKERRHPLWLGLPGALLAVFGYGAGIEGAFSWGQLTKMALSTAAGFVLLSAGLLARAWDDQRAGGASPVFST